MSELGGAARGAGRASKTLLTSVPAVRRVVLDGRQLAEQLRRCFLEACVRAGSDPAVWRRRGGRRTVAVRASVCCISGPRCAAPRGQPAAAAPSSSSVTCCDCDMIHSALEATSSSCSGGDMI